MSRGAAVSHLLPDVRDGLTRKERVILYCLHELQKELKKEYVPSIMLYGRVVEHLDMSEDEVQSILQSLATQ
jgi:DNA gyrase/topoisomerase IV subunit A